MSLRSIAVLCLLLAPSFGRAADSPNVQVSLTDGTTIRGILTEPIVFKFEGGSATFDSTKLDRINFGPPDGSEDSITVHGMDGSIKGRCETREFNFSVDGAPRTVNRDQIKSMRGIHPGPRGLFARVFLPLITLTAMEIVLGIDNIIFLAIVAAKLPKHQQPRARRIGLLAALGTRLGLLATLSFIMSLTAAVFTLPDLPMFHDMEARQISWRDLILLLGGAFLIAKSTFEIHKKLEGPHDEEHESRKGGTARFGLVLIEIAIIDLIFSLDSVITAVGMVESLWIMITAMVIAVGVMMFFAERISRFVLRHPTLKILALAFLILIGVLLVIEGCGQHIDKGYVYFAMAFSVAVEMVNLRLRKKSDPLRLKGTGLPAGIS